MSDFKSLPIRPYNLEKPIGHNHRLGEFICNNTALEQNMYAQYIYNPIVEYNLSVLAEAFLNEAERQSGEVFKIISGYRCRALNQHYREEVSELHIIGAAIDIAYPKNMQGLIDFVHFSKFDQLYLYPHFIHIAVRDTFNRVVFRDFRKR